MRNKEKIIGSIIILIIFLIFLFIGYNVTNTKNIKSVDPDIFVQEDNITKGAENSIKSTNINNKIRVEIKGAVKSPDVYTLNAGDIVLDLVKIAGGYNASADRDSVIQSTKLNDGDCIWVKIKGQESLTENIMETSINHSTNVNAKVNLNTADKEQLMKLDGIGDSRADKIIEYREKNGPFKTIEDLKKVGGRIGDSTIKNIKDKADIK